MNQKENKQSIVDLNNPEFVSLQEFFGEDVQPEAEFISEKLGMDQELVQKALDGADAFMEIAEGNPEYIVEEIDEDGIPVKAISGDKLMAYVKEQTGIDLEILDKIYDCEVDYFDQFGLVD